MKKKVCFLDMDGVLTDFVSQVQIFTGHNVYGFQNRPLTKKEKIIHNKVLYLCDNSKLFWSSMPQMPHAQDVVELCKNNFDEVRILSKYSPPTNKPEKLDVVRKLKTDWIKNMFGTTFNDSQIIITDKPKSSFIEPNNNCYLIDDTIKETTNWIRNGGNGILYKDFESLRNLLGYFRQQRRDLCRR